MNLKFATHEREPFFALAQKYIDNNQKVLDIGAGNGDFANFCNRDDFYLFDGNEKTVELLKHKYKNVYLGRLPKLPFENDLFDVIHCSHVVEHLEPNIFYDTLVEMNRCLKPDGYLIISAPLFWEGFYDDLSHIRPYPTAIYKNYLCNKQNKNRTRNCVSNEYSVEEEIYRFKELKHLNITHLYPRNFIGKLWLKITMILKNYAFKQYQKTGYTIVLKKGCI
ncbi:MAG: class I SAM-dependent methyltransferase [Flavobacterium sp.]|jgi:SAM-dependent methyltransferase|uniref:class I SAM-dependent methyltransferase n=1 Tax=Flavobacterium sp. TaxID=239 RepID=UPI003BA4A799